MISEHEMQIEFQWNTKIETYPLNSVISNDLEVTSSDLAKYSMTRSVARSLCDS